MPKTYTPAERKKAIDAVVAGLSKGTPLTVICCGQGMPCDRTVRDWAETDPELASAIARARDAGWDALAVEALTIMDTEPEMAVSADGSSRRDAGYVAWQKARVETRLKLLAKWDPKRYGELVKLGNADGSNIDLVARIQAGNAKVSE